MQNLTRVQMLRFYAQKILPLVYDESLSYYEYLGKVVQKLNEVIASDNEQSTTIEEFATVFEQMQDDNQAAIDRADEAAGKALEAKEAADGAAEAATLAKEAANTAAEHAEESATKYGSPLTSNTVAGMTDHTRIYVYTGSEDGYTSGNWYYWDGDSWESGGAYVASAGDMVLYTTAQSKSDAQKTQAKQNIGYGNVGEISEQQTSFIKSTSTNRIQTTPTDIDPNAVALTGYYVNSSGVVTESASWNCIAFASPFDSFKFQSNGATIYIVDAYPDVGETVSILEVITSTASMATERTVAKKGSIVVINTGASSKQYLLTDCFNIANIKNLELKDKHDSFKVCRKMDSGVSEYGNESLNITKVEQQLVVATTGGYASNSSYDTYYFQVPVEELTITCTNGFRAAIGYLNPSSVDEFNLISLIYNYASERVDTFTAHYGEWVAISVARTSGEINLKTNYINRFELSALRLGVKQANCFYEYAQDATGKYLYVYFKSGLKYVKWEFHNVPSAGTNSDTWQIGKVYGVTEDLGTSVELVTGGEFELAFKEHGAADFCGGNNHGDETQDSFTLFIDGKKISDLSSITSGYHICNRIDAIEEATVNRCDTPDEDILKHQKVWTFENGTVKIHQTVKFLEELDVDGMLICMLPALRSALAYGVRSDGIAIENMTTNSYSPVRTRINDMYYLMYGDNTTAKVTANSFNEFNDSKSGLLINPTSTLNKLYFTYWEESNSTYPVTVPINTILHWESEYDIAYT